MIAPRALHLNFGELDGSNPASPLDPSPWTLVQALDTGLPRGKISVKLRTQTLYNRGLNGERRREPDRARA